jgi:hypothetical protein
MQRAAQNVVEVTITLGHSWISRRQWQNIVSNDFTAPAHSS